MSLDYSHVIIGAGAVGLAIGARLARSGYKCLILEKNSEVGMETSSRNSEVIHAGLYYPPNSLRSRLCIRGKELIYGLERKVGFKDYRRCGKWIVAQSPKEAEYLEKLRKIARDTGVELDFVPLEKAAEQEPAIIAREAVLNSPTTGIVSSHALMAYYEAELEENGDISMLTEVTNLTKLGGNFAVTCNSMGEEITVNSAKVINAAGLWAPRVASLIGIHQPAYFAKGNYFAYPSSHPRVNRLIYPCPSDQGSLGTHLTLDLGGRLKFGPDFEWIEPISTSDGGSYVDYSVNMANLERAKQAISRYIKLDVNKLVPDYSGVRPKLSKDMSKFHDFSITEPLPGFINLMGIESPGLTASMAIAEHVEQMAT